MGKTNTMWLAALAFAVLGCDGPVEKRIDCIKICNEAADCVGGDDFNKGDCKEQCNEDADQSDVDRCEQCLSDQDSCSEDLKCTAECSGVLTDIVFK